MNTQGLLWEREDHALKDDMIRNMFDMMIASGESVCGESQIK